MNKTRPELHVYKVIIRKSKSSTCGVFIEAENEEQAESAVEWAEVDFPYLEWDPDEILSVEVSDCEPEDADVRYTDITGEDPDR